MTSELQSHQTQKAAKYFDMRLPLWGMLGVLVGIGWVLINMYFTIDRTARDVVKLQSSSELWTAQMNTLTGEQALLKYRVANIEGDVRDLKNHSGDSLTPSGAHK